MSAQRELRARELRASGEESARVDPCPRTTDAYVTRDVASFAEQSLTAECSMDCSEEQVALLVTHPQHPGIAICIWTPSFLHASRLAKHPALPALNLYLSCTVSASIACHQTLAMQDWRQPEPCSYLQSGQQFQGTQRVSQASASASEDWGVEVHIEVQLHVAC